MVWRSVVIGTGSALPERIVGNAELATRVETSDEWIVERTGIRQRYVAAEGQLTSDLAIEASRRALEMGGVLPRDVDMIVLATATPDETFPATATRVQHALGCYGGAAFDVSAVCSGFIYALTVADNFIRLGQAKTALVIGAETFTRLLDWSDRSTCVLFGDGAGAVVLRAEQGSGAVFDRGVLATCLHADGQHHDLLYVDGGPSSTQSVGQVRMSGREVFRHAVANLATAVQEVLDKVELDIADVDWFIPHQANSRILEATARKLNLPPDKIVITVDRHANTSAASVPLALDEAVRDGRIRPNHLAVLEAMGGGFTWGSVLIRM